MTSTWYGDVAQTPGHSPAPSVAELSAGGEPTILAGDLLRTPEQILQPARGARFDDHRASAGTGARFLARAADTHAAFIAGDFTVERTARITRCGESNGSTAGPHLPKCPRRSQQQAVTPSNSTTVIQACPPGTEATATPERAAHRPGGATPDPVRPPTVPLRSLQP